MTTSRRRKDSFFEGAQCALFLVDEAGQILQANRRAVEVTGFPRRKLEESNICEVLQPLEWAEVWGHLNSIASKSHRMRLSSAISSQRGDPVQTEVFVRLYQTTKSPRSALVRARDIREENYLRDRLRERIRSASVSHERDRKRMARALHDGAIHDLLTTTTSLDRTIRAAEGTEFEPQLRQVKLDLAGLMESMRELVEDLRADELEAGDLVSGLNALIVTTGSEGPEAELVVSNPGGRLNKHARFLIYRIAQEAIRNVERHAHATEVRVHLECDDQWLRLSISDNGCGFTAPLNESDAARVGALGLQGAYERASLLGGVLSIESTEGHGTEVRLSVPLSIVCEQPSDSPTY